MVEQRLLNKDFVVLSVIASLVKEAKSFRCKEDLCVLNVVQPCISTKLKVKS
ncbi:MAG: hypothetical protein N2511_03235 [Thermodesulfovibrionales bacterium]|nr:hypothetical protein [Thermodesulfovibrionales bacterium]